MLSLVVMSYAPSPTEIESMGTRPSLAHRPEVRIKGENEVAGEAEAIESNDTELENLRVEHIQVER